MRQLLSFCHIPKTGGTTFESLIKKNIGDKYYRFSEYKYPFGNWLERKSPELLACGGHYDWNFPHDCGLFNDREIKSVVFLRDPVERSLSFLYFCSKRYHDNVCGFFTDHTNGDWKYRSNTMTKFLAGINREPNMADLGLARSRLKKSIVCFTESFDEDLKNIQEIFPNIFKDLEYEYKNKCKWEKNKHTVEDLEIIKSVNQYDIELYQWAKECLLWDRFMEV